MKQNVFFWIARLVAAAIMLQTLYFKFMGAEESVYIFSTIGMEPWGRIGVGVFELIASVLLIIPVTVWAGSILAIGLMGGALLMHVAFLGIEVKDDGGQLFIYAVIVLLCAVYAFWQSRSQLPESINRFLPSFLK